MNESVEQAFDRFTTFLDEQGYRLTQEREQIARTVFSDRRRFEAEELLYTLRRQGKNVSRATIYRTLELLVNSGEVTKLSFEDGYSVYEVTGETPPDGHLYCRQCGKVTEFNRGELAGIREEVCAEHDFHAEEVSHKILGYCSDCWQVVDKDS